MGDPKYPRRMWRKPKRPLNYELKMEELKTLGTFGLKTKRELWKAHTELSRIRHQARSLLALGQEIREEKEPILMKSLRRIGLVGESSTLDDVLNLHVEELLGRRLQTIVMKKLGFKTPYQARQAVIHGHIMIGDRIVNVPSYTVTVNEEKDIKLTPGSSLKDLLEKISKNESSEKTKAEKTDSESSDMDDKNVESVSDEGENDSTDKPEE
ncbi:MAG: 30S ribosomal protein S4 [Crenarchaeota archaeon]|nr:MAG: 30S ribosomal protein S4 [Thermoproteota archaeon]RDJ33555.1 MAG: 30S ribosomal protein S4 [Thermoproteota archaeon]RDJ38123.1 MAG: 30S ribosomal protein S4 [Thermoproteota archaeon]RDJ39108.1 MAG: 30S ribosomal protein S4 [Thermoproteota archaeon]